ncbi:MAG: hypothetical protein VYA30_04815 [Myxococcota bacterium]|nr:hypothetical protein [Myxococcota bacterium]
MVTGNRLDSKIWSALAIWFGAYGVLLILSRHWPFPGEALFAFSISFVLLSFCVVISAACASGVVEHAGRLPPWHALVPLGFIGLGTGVPLPPDWVYPWYGFSLLWLASVLGARLGSEIQISSHVWPLILVACAFDYWSVMAPAGLTHAMVEEPRLVSSINPLILVFPIPLAGPQPILGVGDVVFAGFCMGIVKKLALNATRACVGLVAGLLVCLGLLLTMQIPLPALLCIGPAFGLSFGGVFKPRFKDLLGALVFVAVGLFVLTALRSA